MEKFITGTTLYFTERNRNIPIDEAYNVLEAHKVADVIVGNSHQRRKYPDYNLPQHYPAFTIDTSDKSTSETLKRLGIKVQDLPNFGGK